MENKIQCVRTKIICVIFIIFYRYTQAEDTILCLSKQFLEMKLKLQFSCCWSEELNGEHPLRNLECSIQIDSNSFFSSLII